MRVLVLQGPNLNLLGQREPETYGAVTLESVRNELDALASELGVQLEHMQSNHEGELVDKVQEVAREGYDGVVINPGAYTHTSIALRDAFLSTALPFVEVHISNVYQRESFRHKSLLSDIAAGVVVGLGTNGYALGLRGLANHLASR